MKMIFLDADGTLFHPMGYIPQSSFKAIDLAQKNGHKVCLCTGRQKAEVYGDLMTIDYDGMVVGAGAYVEAKDRVLCDLTFSESQRKELLDYFLDNHIPCLFESSFKVYANKEAIDKMNQLIEIQCAKLSSEEKEGHGLVLVLHSAHLEADEVIRSAKINKISFLESNISFNEINEKFKENYDVIPATFAPFGKESGEIGNKEISKGHGMEYLMNYYHIPQEDVIAIGDGYNDLKMFEKAHVSIAMGNAPDDIKQICDWTTSSIDEDGIYNAFKKLGII